MISKLGVIIPHEGAQANSQTSPPTHLTHQPNSNAWAVIRCATMTPASSAFKQHATQSVAPRAISPARNASTRTSSPRNRRSNVKPNKSNCKPCRTPKSRRPRNYWRNRLSWMSLRSLKWAFFRRQGLSGRKFRLVHLLLMETVMERVCLRKGFTSDSFNLCGIMLMDIRESSDICKSLFH